MLMKLKSGYSLIEVVLASAILAVLSLAFSFIVIQSNQDLVYSGIYTRANFLAEEGLEVVKNIKDQDFNQLQEGIYGLSIVNNIWELVNSQEQIENFTREITIHSEDGFSKLVTAKVTWSYGANRTGSVTLKTKVYNLKR